MPTAMAPTPNAGKTTTEAAAAPIAKAEVFSALLVHCLAFAEFFSVSGLSSSTSCWENDWSSSLFWFETENDSNPDCAENSKASVENCVVKGLLNSQE